MDNDQENIAFNQKMADYQKIMDEARKKTLPVLQSACETIKNQEEGDELFELTTDDNLRKNILQKMISLAFTLWQMTSIDRKHQDDLETYQLLDVFNKKELELCRKEFTADIKQSCSQIYDFFIELRGDLARNLVLETGLNLAKNTSESFEFLKTYENFCLEIPPRNLNDDQEKKILIKSISLMAKQEDEIVFNYREEYLQKHGLEEMFKKKVIDIQQKFINRLTTFDSAIVALGDENNQKIFDLIRDKAFSLIKNQDDGYRLLQRTDLESRKKTLAKIIDLIKNQKDIDAMRDDRWELIKKYELDTYLFEKEKQIRNKR